MWRLGNCGGFVYFCPFVYCVFVYYCQCLLSISLLYIRCFCGSGEPCGRAVTKGERNNLRDVQSFSISMCIQSQYFFLAIISMYHLPQSPYESIFNFFMCTLSRSSYAFALILSQHWCAFFFNIFEYLIVFFLNLYVLLFLIFF